MPSQDGRLTVLRTRYKSLSGSGLEYKASCNNNDVLIVNFQRAIGFLSTSKSQYFFLKILPLKDISNAIKTTLSEEKFRLCCKK